MVSGAMFGHASAAFSVQTHLLPGGCNRAEPYRSRVSCCRRCGAIRYFCRVFRSFLGGRPFGQDPLHLGPEIEMELGCLWRCQSAETSNKSSRLSPPFSRSGKSTDGKLRLPPSGWCWFCRQGLQYEWASRVARSGWSGHPQLPGCEAFSGPAPLPAHPSPG